MSSNLENEADSPTGLGRYISLLVLIIALFSVLVVPLKIVGYGYIPPDDALADSAKAITGKPWPDILVLKGDFAIDNHIGWHALLRIVYLLTKCQDDSLVVLSMTALFVLVGWSALPWLKRPEAWLIVLILSLGVQAPFMGRFLLGRPLMWSMFSLVTLLFLNHVRGASPPGKVDFMAMTGLIALAILLHGVWYFWALALAAFVLAGQWRWAMAFAICWMAGTVLGAACTGQPVVYLIEAWRQALSAIGLHASQSTMVGELQPTTGNYFPLLLVGGLMVLRPLAKLPCRPLSSQPAFWLACIGWVLGFKAERFWDDWGMPALMALIVFDLDLLLEIKLAATDVKRLALAAGLAATLFLTTTSDAGSRWSGSAKWDYLSADDPNLAGWMPQPGGIFYTSDMELFYHTFFKNPTAPWRYTAGYEPALMPPEDFQTYQQILVNYSDPDSYRPWIKKMRSEDRMALNSRSNPSSFLPDLEWKHAVDTLWLGRRPRAK